jgi:phytoene desaturase
VKSVAVIGAGIGGLTAAGALAAKGYRVTLFEATGAVGGKAQVLEVEGLRFDTGPTVMTMPATVRSTFESLQAPDLMPELIRLELQTQYHFADEQQFSCWDDLNRTVESASRMEPADGAGLRRFYETARRVYEAAGAPYLEAPYESMLGFIARAARSGPTALATGLKLSTLDALATSHFRSAAMRQFAGRFATYAGASPYEANAAFAMIAHLERAYGVHHVRGGIGALINALLTAVQRLGVEVRLLSKTWWKPSGAQFEVGDGAFDSVVINADPLATLGRESERLAMSGCVFFFEAPQRLSLPHHSIVFSGDSRAEFAQLSSGAMPSEPTLHLCHPAATDSSMAPEGKSGLYVMANTPPLNAACDAEYWAANQDRLRAWCLQRIRSVAGLERVELRSVGQRTPVDLARQGAPHGSIYGYLPRGRFGPFRRPPMRATTPGVFFAGGGTHPGGGVPLVMLSGRFAAGLADAHLGGSP